jgi:hypothetical protein
MAGFVLTGMYPKLQATLLLPGPRGMVGPTGLPSTCHHQYLPQVLSDYRNLYSHLSLALVFEVLDWIHTKVPGSLSSHNPKHLRTVNDSTGVEACPWVARY